MIKKPGTCGTLATVQKEKAIDELTVKILAVIRKHTGLSGNKICQELGGNRNRVYEALRKGKDKNWKVENNGYFEID